MNRRQFLNKNLAIIFTSCILLIIGCHKNPVDDDINNTGFNIHFLKDEKITLYEIIEKNLTDLTVNPEPWISSDDIDYYDISSHIIYLKKEIDYPWISLPTGGKPFYVFANDEYCYTGCLLPSFSSWSAPNYPKIMMPLLHKNLLPISFNGDQEQDPRSDSRIIDALLATEKIKSYSRISSEKYRYYFYFPSPSNIEKNKRQLPDGRIWIGRIKSTETVVNLNED